MTEVLSKHVFQTKKKWSFSLNLYVCCYLDLLEFCICFNIRLELQGKQVVGVIA